MIKNLVSAVKGMLGSGGDTPPAPAQNLAMPEESFLILKDKCNETEFELHSDGLHINGLKGKSVVPLTDDFGGIGQVDEEIRVQIAQKISMLVPSLAASKKDLLMVHVFKVLSMLAEDQETRVRRMIAEELSSSFNVPMDVVHKLAWDSELEVCGPVLEASPLLGDADLMEIIRNSDIPGVREAVSRREIISEDVTDAIVKSIDMKHMDDSEERTIQNLLENENARFYEETLETIIDEAEHHECWQESIVKREELTNRTINKVAKFVSHAVLDEMRAKGLINEDVGKKLAGAVAMRLQSVQLDREVEADRIISELFTKGEVTPEFVLTLINNGKFDQVNAALVMLSGVPKSIIKTIWEAADPKAVISLTWKAGFAMRDTIPFQLKMGKVPHPKVLYAKNGTDYPLSHAEMQKILDGFLKKAAQ